MNVTIRRGIITEVTFKSEMEDGTSRTVTLSDLAPNAGFEYHPSGYFSIRGFAMQMDEDELG